MNWECHDFSLISGRIKISLSAIWLGRDAQLLLAGGRAHAGAVAVCHAGGVPYALELPGHREGEIAREIAQTISRALKNTMVVTCGIHYDNISKDEINTALTLCRRLAQNFLESAQRMSHDYN